MVRYVPIFALGKSMLQLLLSILNYAEIFVILQAKSSCKSFSFKRFQSRIPYGLQCLYVRQPNIRRLCPADVIQHEL